MKNILILIISIVISGCASLVAPNYTPSTDNGNILNDLTSNKISVGTFTQAGSEVNDFSMRGGNLVSPYNQSFSEYLSWALIEELKFAGIYDGKSKIRISGVLINNQVEAAIGTGTASITAKFVVRRNNKTIYDKQVLASHEWESSFAGAIAIPAAQNNYPIVVQKLLKNLFSDEDFVAAVR